MDKGGSSILPRIVDAVWRRRYLVLVPVVTMTLFSVLGVLLLPLPGKYVAHSLMLLQEASRKNPLSKEPSRRPNAEELQEDLAGLRALLDSEYVLGPVVDATDEKLESDPRRRVIEIEDLRKRVSVNVIGDDFLEFALVGSHPRGLGSQLDAITSRLMEALTSQSGTNVGTALISKQKHELDIAEQENTVLKERLVATLPGGLEAHRAQIKALNQHLDKAQQTLTSTNAALEEIRARLQTPNLTSEQALREVAKLGTASDLRSANSQRSITNTPALSDRASALRKFLDLDQTQSNLQKEVDDDIRTRDRLQHLLDVNDVTIRKLEDSEKSLESIRRIFEASQRRFGASAATGGSHILRAPERIIVIDPARDPIIGGTPKIYFLLSGVFAGLLIGIGLAAAAEYLDDTLRYPGQVIAITGVPIIAHLPSKRRSAPITAGVPPLIEQTNWGGLARSSDEGTVMGPEQRGGIR